MSEEYPFKNIVHSISFKPNLTLVEVSKTTGWRRIFFWRKREFKTVDQIWQEAIERHRVDMEKTLGISLYQQGKNSMTPPKPNITKYEKALQEIEFNLRHGGCGCCDGCSADMKLAASVARKAIGAAKTWKTRTKLIKK